MIKLVLFDLDGTLVDVFDLHFKLEREIIKGLYDVNIGKKEWITGIGLVEKDFLNNLLNPHDISSSEISKKHGTHTKEKKKMIIKSLKEKKRRPLAGVLPVLEELKKRKITTGLVTGNQKDAGTEIVKAHCLRKYLAIEAYADGIKERKKLVIKAIKMTEKKTGEKLRMNEILVVGDSIYDIRSGKQNKCKTLAVATGYTSKKELKKEKPDYLFDNLKNTKAFLKIL